MMIDWYQRGLALFGMSYPLVINFLEDSVSIVVKIVVPIVGLWLMVTSIRSNNAKKRADEARAQTELLQQEKLRKEIHGT